MLLISIWYGFNIVLSQKISHGMWLLAYEFLLYSTVLPLRMHLYSGYYYYNYVINNRCAEVILGKQKFSVWG